MAPDDHPRRNVYVCESGTLNVRNHLGVRDVLRSRADLRDRYGDVKLALAADPQMDIGRYLAGKSAVLQEVLVQAGLGEEERRRIWELNTSGALARAQTPGSSPPPATGGTG